MVDCVCCGAKGSEIVSQTPLASNVNRFNRTELTLQVVYKENVRWVPDKTCKDKGYFHCGVCGKTFSFNEHTMSQDHLVNKKKGE